MRCLAASCEITLAGRGGGCTPLEVALVTPTGGVGFVLTTTGCPPDVERNSFMLCEVCPEFLNAEGLLSCEAMMLSDCTAEWWKPDEPSRASGAGWLALLGALLLLAVVLLAMGFCKGGGILLGGGGPLLRVILEGLAPPTVRVRTRTLPPTTGAPEV